MTIIDDFRLMEKHGFEFLPYKLAKTKEEAKKIAKEIHYPIVMKVVSDEIIHKTDVGGVKVGIKNEKALEIAWDEITKAVKKYKIDGIMIQKMGRKGIELIIGGKKDPQFGHLIILGLGGVYVEVFKDISARLCPVCKQDVKEMVQELKSHPILQGTRGKKGINIKKLEELMVKTCKFMEKEDIKELDLNPVIFNDKGYDIVDVRFLK